MMKTIAVGTLLIACAAAVGCVSPETTRTRGDGPGADVGREPAIHQIGGQVHGDERQLEAAGEETEHEQHVGAVGKGLAQGVGQRLRFRAMPRL